MGYASQLTELLHIFDSLLRQRVHKAHIVRFHEHAANYVIVTVRREHDGHHRYARIAVFCRVLSVGQTRRQRGASVADWGEAMAF